MNKRETARRLAHARKGIVDVKPIGAVFAKKLITKRHGDVHLPRDDIFAFVANGDTPSESQVIVSEVDERIKIVGCAWHKDLNMAETHFDELVTLAFSEAEECGIKPPFSLTLANEHGVFSFIPNTKKRRRVA